MIYSLKVIHGETYNSKICGVRGCDAPLIVGQCEGAELRFQNDTEYEDVDFFVILKDTDKEGWHLVRLESDEYIFANDTSRLLVNGCPVGKVCYLKDGDRISSGKVELKFNLIDEEKLFPGHTEDIPIRKVIWRNIIAAFAAAVVLFFAFYGIPHYLNRQIEKKDIIKFENSIYRISVPYAVFSDKCGDDVIYDTIPVQASGTCFVTSDGTLITARHCIEPWLEFDCKKQPQDSSALERENLVQYAARYTTERIFGRDPKLECEVIVSDSEDNELLRLKSTDFIINDSRDILCNIGTRQNPEFINIIFPSYHKEDCALDDFAYYDNCGLNGEITPASFSVLDRMKDQSSQRDISIFVAGYKRQEDNSYMFNTDKGSLESFEQGSCLKHKEDADHGDSGAPVFIRQKGKVYAVSVYSRRDERDKCGWSVPLTEIEKTSKGGE